MTKILYSRNDPPLQEHIKEDTVANQPRWLDRSFSPTKLNGGKCMKSHFERFERIGRSRLEKFKNLLRWLASFVELLMLAVGLWWFFRLAVVKQVLFKEPEWPELIAIFTLALICHNLAQKPPKEEEGGTTKTEEKEQ